MVDVIGAEMHRARVEEANISMQTSLLTFLGPTPNHAQVLPWYKMSIDNVSTTLLRRYDTCRQLKNESRPPDLDTMKAPSPLSPYPWISRVPVYYC
jgi:hypothetical protein